MTKAIPSLGVGIVLVALNVPSWAALLAGCLIALVFNQALPPSVKPWTSRVLQAGVVLLGAGMNLQTVLLAGRDGALMTAVSLVVALVLGTLLGRVLKVPKDTSLLLSVGTAICGGSAIAAVASVIKPKDYETSTALAVVFVLNGVGLVVFPAIGHALALDDLTFGRWAALAIHDTSSVVGAAMSYSPEALSIATTTKLARALWIVPLTVAVFFMRKREGGLQSVKWPYFILAFLLVAAVFTWIPALSPAQAILLQSARRLLVLALYLVGLSLTRASLAKIGPRPLVQGVILWLCISVLSLPLARS